MFVDFLNGLYRSSNVFTVEEYLTKYEDLVQSHLCMWWLWVLLLLLLFSSYHKPIKYEGVIEKRSWMIPTYLIVATSNSKNNSSRWITLATTFSFNKQLRITKIVPSSFTTRVSQDAKVQYEAMLKVHFRYKHTRLGQHTSCTDEKKLSSMNEQYQKKKLYRSGRLYGSFHQRMTCWPDLICITPHVS